MSANNRLTVDQIRKMATSQSFLRGQSYYHSGSVFNQTQRERILEANCSGSQGSPYQVRVTLGNDQQVIEATCTCNYDYGGYCKHIVAVLLNYLHEPDSFITLVPIAELLAPRNREELIDLIQCMVAKHPDLQYLVERPSATRADSSKPVDTNSYRKELKRAFKVYPDQWGDSDPFAVMWSVAQSGDEFAMRGDWRSASAIYRALLEESLQEDGDYMYDEEGNFEEIINYVLKRLELCLDIGQLKQFPDERKAILRQILATYIWNNDHIGTDMAYDALDMIVCHAAVEDIPEIRQQVEHAEERIKRIRGSDVVTPKSWTQG